MHQPCLFIYILQRTEKIIYLLVYEEVLAIFIFSPSQSMY